MKTSLHQQSKLFDDLTWDFEIKKHSSFIQMHSEASLMQRKLINGIIYIIKDQIGRSPEQRIFIMDLWVLKKLSGIQGTNNNHLKQALKGIMDMSIEYNILGKDKKEIWWTFSFLSFVQIEVEQRGKASIIKIECPTIVLEAIRRPRMYANLNLIITRGINSKHALALYELLVDYIKIGKLSISVEDMRKLFWIQEHQYRWGFKMFKSRVIDKAIDEINTKTDIHIKIDEPERIGRKVVGITFHTTKQLDYQIEEISSDELIQKLVANGFSQKRAVQISKEHDKEYILANIAVVEEQYQKRGKVVKSIPALLTTAFKTDFRSPENEYTKQQKKLKQNKQKQQEQEHVILNQEIQLMTAFQEWIKQLYEKHYAKLSEKEIEAYKSAFIEQLGDMHIASKYIEKAGFEHRVVKASFEKYLREQLLTSEELDFAVFKKSYSKTVGQIGAE